MKRMVELTKKVIGKTAWLDLCDKMLLDPKATASVFVTYLGHENKKGYGPDESSRVCPDCRDRKRCQLPVVLQQGCFVEV